MIAVGQRTLNVNRRLLVTGAGVAGMVVGLVLLVTVLGGGGGEVKARSSRPPTPAVAPKPAPSTPTLPYLPATRDPFRQNATVPKGGSGQASTQAASAVAASPVPTRTATPPSDANGKASLELKSVAPDVSGTVRATVIVDGQSYSPANGETFAHGYRLERIDGNCVEVSAQAARAHMCVAATTR